MLKYVSFGLNRYTGHCLKALEYMLFYTICYTAFWSLFVFAEIYVFSYHIHTNRSSFKCLFSIWFFSQNFRIDRFVPF